jgi:signal transduction histidine kinase
MLRSLLQVISWHISLRMQPSDLVIPRMYALGPGDDAHQARGGDDEHMAISGTYWLIIALAACAVAGWLALALVRERRLRYRAIEDRRRLLDREREHAARTAVDAERARIAQELHDIVSHNVSLMIVQTSAALEVLETMPGQAATALRAVEAAGRDTMTELRHLLGLLAPSQSGEGEEAADLSPQPSLTRLTPLVDRIAFAGLPVELRISGEPRPLPAGIDLTAYRIVQEALTNALKHGDGGEAEVTIRYAGHSLRVEILTSGPSVLSGGRPTPKESDGTGRGLVGLRERVAVYGGDLDARRRLGGGYRVRARIPLDRP